MLEKVGEITISVGDKKILVRKECGKTIVDIFTYDEETGEHYLVDEGKIV